MRLKVKYVKNDGIKIAYKHATIAIVSYLIKMIRPTWGAKSIICDGTRDMYDRNKRCFYG